MVNKPLTSVEMDRPPHHLKITARFPQRNCNRAFSCFLRNQQHAASVFNPEDQAFWNQRRIALTDPRYTDPPFNTGLGGPWGWIAGIAVIVLIAWVVIAGINQSTNTASDKPLAMTESAPSGGTKPPSTTGFGATGFTKSSPQPMMSPPAQPMSPPTRP